MQITFHFKLLVLFMIVLMFNMPFIVLAQQESIRTQAESDAERDVKARVNKNVWRIFGCVGGLITVAGVYLYQPTPPAGALIGKSPEYVAFYTDKYIQDAKELQMASAMEGCIGGACLSASLYGCIFAILSADN